MTPPERDRERFSDLIAVAVVVLAATLPYLSTINDYFLQDDFGVIQLMSSRPWTMFFRWFTLPWMENIWMYTPDEIRPFVALSYVMTAAWGAGSPAGHHALNIAIHAGNGLLVMWIARGPAGLSRTAAAFAAVIFVLLPVQAESVAWITGRVDSMPAFFYLAAFLSFTRWRACGLCFAQRRSGRRSGYAWSLVWFFIALFSKQNTITLPAALVAYDFIVVRRPLRPSWEWLRPYAPFGLMTIGFLWLRYVVVGTVVRESQLSGEGLRLFERVVGHHTQRVVFGHLSAVRSIEWVAVAALMTTAAFAFTRLDAARRRRLGAAALFFGVAWWVLGIAPIAVAGYESPRHVYLAAAGWAMLLAVVFQVIADACPVRAWQPARLAWRQYAIVTAAALVLASYSAQLWAVVRLWNRNADISKGAVARLELEANATEPGSLVIVGAPIPVWEWAAPFMAQPPYTQSDLTTRVHLVTPQRLNCCGGHWLDQTRAAIGKWTAQPTPAPIVALYVNPRSGAVSRLTDSDYPPLRTLVPALLQIDTLDALNRAILRLLDDLVATRPAG